MRWLRSISFWAGIILLVSILWKAVLLALHTFPFNADEAIVGLMARHILSGERPLFFYGQAYMGSLDAFLVAVGFSIFGSQVWVIRLIQIILYTLFIISTLLIGRVAFGSWKHGLLAAVFLAIPAVNTTLYTTVSLGGYGEALLIGSLGLLLGFWMSQPVKLRSPAWMVGWGFLAGLGLWANALSWVFFIPMGIYLLVRVILQAKAVRRWKTAAYFLFALAGFLLGSLPWWIFALQHGFGGLIRELFGNAVAVEGGSLFSRSASHLVSLILLGLPAAMGLRPPWAVRWLALPLLPLALFFSIAAGGYLFRKRHEERQQNAAYAVLGGVVITLVLLFIFTPFGVDPSGRYFLPLILPLALGAAGWLLSLQQRWLAGILAALVLAFNLWGTLDCAFRNPPGITTQFYEPAQVDMAKLPEVMTFLRSEGETRGYSNYWVAYPLAFESGEELIFTPRLPYHLDLGYTRRDERYQPYADAVNLADKVAYITTRNPALDERLKLEFGRLGITWQEMGIGDFTVYYHLSRVVRPEELDLNGVTP